MRPHGLRHDGHRYRLNDNRCRDHEMGRIVARRERRAARVDVRLEARELPDPGHVVCVCLCLECELGDAERDQQGD
jgi:hypothetical protein